MATSTQIKTQIDTDITNKTTPNSVSPTNIGTNMKAAVDFVVQEKTDAILQANDYTDTQLAVVTSNFKYYEALLSQTGTGNPIAIVLDNTFTGPIVWTRISTGLYEGILNGAFTNLKTSLQLTPIGVGISYTIFPIDDNTIQIKTYNMSIDGFADGQLNESTVIIKVYN